MTTARGGADQYRAWARQYIGGTEQQIDAAAQELLLQKAAGASGPQAVKARLRDGSRRGLALGARSRG